MSGEKDKLDLYFIEKNGLKHFEELWKDSTNEVSGTILSLLTVYDEKKEDAGYIDYLLGEIELDKTFREECKKISNFKSIDNKLNPYAKSFTEDYLEEISQLLVAQEKQKTMLLEKTFEDHYGFISYFQEHNLTTTMGLMILMERYSRNSKHDILRFEYDADKKSLDIISSFKKRKLFRKEEVTKIIGSFTESDAILHALFNLFPNKHLQDIFNVEYATTED